MQAIHPDDISSMKELFREVLQGTQQISLAYRVINGANEYVWFKLIGNVHRMEDGRIIIYCCFSDIDEQMKAQITLKENQILLNTAMRSAKMSSWEYEVGTKRAILTEAAQKQHGLSRIVENLPESLIACGFVHPDSAMEFRTLFSCTFEKEAAIQRDIRIYAQEGKDYRWEHYILTPVYDKNGRHVKSIGTSMNIAEQKKMELKYQEELQHVNTANDANLVAKGVYNLSQNNLDYYLMKNEDAAENKVGMTYDKALQKTAALSLTEEKRQEMLHVLNRKRLIGEFAKGNTEFEVEYQRKQTGRPVIWVSAQCRLYVQPYTQDIMCFVYSYDISTQKIFKEMLDTIVNLDYDYLALLDCENKDYKMYAGNDRNQTALPSSYSNAYEDEVAKYAREYLIPEDVESNIHDMSIANLQEKLSKQDVFTSTCSMKERNGTIRRKKLQFSYLDRENGRILITRSDITDVYQKEQEYIQTLKKAMASAQQANIAKTDFLSRMSHDLRTPMNAIIGLTALAKDEITDAAAIDEYLDKINSAGNFLLGLVNDCLDIEKIASGKMELHPRPYHYDEFKNSIQTMFQPLCRQKNITFAFVEGNTGDTILADKVRFEQIFFNLLSNAVKFTPEGGKVEFIVTDEVRDQGILSADFTVRDNGCGMSEEFQRSGLFTPFEQEQNENTAQTQGTGLGLSIVKSIVDMMNGNLQIKSEQGKGTEIRVHLELPLVSDAGQGENLLQKKCNGSLTGAHVLLVEDHPLNIEIAKKLLEKCKMVVTCAGNGEEALKIFNTSVLNYYQAILMDIRMPVMNGLDATKAIRELERVDAKTVPIIAMTANAFEEDVELTKEAGMNAHLSKPIEPQRLYETLEKNIRWQKQER